MKPGLSVVKGKTCWDVIHGDVPGCIEVVRQAYLAHGDRRSVNPDSYFLRFPEKPNARIIALPAYLGAPFETSGIKWIASYPDNIASGLPRASAVLVLNDYETGYPYAFLESAIISAARTAASATLAAQTLLGGPQRGLRLGIIGTGLISRYTQTFLSKAGWAFREVSLFDKDPSEAARFETQSRSSGNTDVTTHRRTSAEDVIRHSDLVILATTAATPHLQDVSVLAHRPVLLHLSLRDLAPELILAARNVVDDVEHVLKAQTSVHLTEQRVGHRSFIDAALPELLSGAKACAADRARVFSPFGLGVLDLAVGKWVLGRALEQGTAVQMDDFFYELSR